jgi:hypothetical protein
MENTNHAQNLESLRLIVDKLVTDMSAMKGQLQTAVGAIDELRAEIAVIHDNSRLS